MTDNLSRQVEEIEALCSIYGNEWKTEDEENRSYSIKIEGAVLYVILPSDYPSASPPQYQLSAPYLGINEKQLISSQLDEVYLENIGETVIFQWVEKIRELLQQMQLPEHFQEEEEGIEDWSEETYYVESVSIPLKTAHKGFEIIHGTTITDRKSVFQGHVAIVTTLEDVRQVMDKLKENRKIANATHNISAYRIYNGETKAYLQDCDDDGETQAGGRLLHLLQILDVQNVVVVVSRWYGGVHLGPDRFRHINNAARQVLETAGFIKSSKQQKKSKKKEK